MRHGWSGLPGVAKGMCIGVKNGTTALPHFMAYTWTGPFLPVYLPSKLPCAHKKILSSLSFVTPTVPAALFALYPLMGKPMITEQGRKPEFGEIPWSGGSFSRSAQVAVKCSL